MNEELSKEQLKVVANYLFDGDLRVPRLMGQIRRFKRGDHVLLWLVKNKIKGSRMVEFFKDASGNDEDMGVLVGVQAALNNIDGHKFHKETLTLEDLK